MVVIQMISIFINEFLYLLIASLAYYFSVFGDIEDIKVKSVYQLRHSYIIVQSTANS